MLECVRFVFDCFCKAAPGTFPLEILRESDITDSKKRGLQQWGRNLGDQLGGESV